VVLHGQIRRKKPKDTVNHLGDHYSSTNKQHTLRENGSACAVQMGEVDIGGVRPRPGRRRADEVAARQIDAMRSDDSTTDSAMDIRRSKVQRSTLK
jgi:hypothetical protein